MDGLQDFLTKIQLLYKNNSYPFARAYLPQQKIESGQLTIQVVEGSYGEVTVTGHPEFLEKTSNFVFNLKPGEVIQGDVLERTALVLKDLPGVISEIIIMPGQLLGEADVMVDVSREAGLHGSIGLDNYGGKAVGEVRSIANLIYNSPFLFGDQISLGAFYTEGDTWFGSMAYSFPVNYDGFRANLAYIHTEYQLGESFSSLNAYGDAKISRLGVSYPIKKSKAANIEILANFEHKVYDDTIKAISTNSNKLSNVIPVMLAFDFRDQFLASGVTYGTFTVARGRLNLGASLRATDEVTAKTDGYFTKYNLDISRVQAIANNMNAYVRLSAQKSNKNLDSSESFGLGGSNGVRAFPVGEGYGDEGWLTQWELRRHSKHFEPYIFYDIGNVKTNAKPFDGSGNKRTLSGAGIGTKMNYNKFSLDASVAWRLAGEPESGAGGNKPKWWITCSYSL